MNLINAVGCISSETKRGALKIQSRSRRRCVNPLSPGPDTEHTHILIDAPVITFISGHSLRPGEKWKKAFRVCDMTQQVKPLSSAEVADNAENREACERRMKKAEVAATAAQVSLQEARELSTNLVSRARRNLRS